MNSDEKDKMWICGHCGTTGYESNKPLKCPKCGQWLEEY